MERARRHRRGRGAFFDQSVFGGFPGEGWRAGLVACAVLVFSSGVRTSEAASPAGVPGGGLASARAGSAALADLRAGSRATPTGGPPPARGDLARAAARSAPLPRGRPVGERTRGRRFVCLQWLDSWLQGRGYHLADLLEAKEPDVYLINALLEEYGHFLWRSGAVYYKLSETINAVSGVRGELRRSLGRAWDVAYSWLDQEPGGHHVAMPVTVLRALVTLALLWGWPRVGALLAAGWYGMLRPVEFLSAERGDLIFPADVLHAVAHLRWSIREPKTKRLGARAQSARIDDLQVIQLLSAVFARLPPSARLWPLGQEGFRRRFTTLCRALGLPTGKGGGLDLGALRAGGATALFEATEDGELVRSRGRWLQTRTMMIYIQEITAASFVSRLEPRVRADLREVSLIGPRVLELATAWATQDVPPGLWPGLFQDVFK